MTLQNQQRTHCWGETQLRDITEDSLPTWCFGDYWLSGCIRYSPGERCQVTSEEEEKIGDLCIWLLREQEGQPHGCSRATPAPPAGCPWPVPQPLHAEPAPCRAAPTAGVFLAWKSATKS